MSGWDADGCAHLSELERRCAGSWLKVDPATVCGPPTGLLVGEMPGASSSSALPLFPYPKNSAGGRLLSWSRITPGQYLGRLLRCNLFVTPRPDWDEILAHELANDIMRAATPELRIVLLGKRVAEAFEVYRVFEMQKRTRDDGQHYFICAIPHPSGRNLVYNEPVARVGAAAAIQWASDSIAPPTEKAQERAEKGKRR